MEPFGEQNFSIHNILDFLKHHSELGNRIFRVGRNCQSVGLVHHELVTSSGVGSLEAEFSQLIYKLTACRVSTGSSSAFLFKSMSAITGRGCPSFNPTRIQSSSVERNSFS